jgi:murein DD-endopeptidase MepM/ murein hydrolase activator NlpD
VLAVAPGTVTKLGYPYSQPHEGQTWANEDDRRRFMLKAAMRYVEVTTRHGYRVRYFYVQPDVSVGDRIAEGRVLGLAQHLQPIYPGIIDHYHFEVLTPSGEVADPYRFLEDLL